MVTWLSKTMYSNNVQYQRQLKTETSLLLIMHQSAGLNRTESLGILTDALVTFGLLLACDDRTMPIFAFWCGLRRVTLRCPDDSTTSYDLRSLYDFVIVCTIANFKNRKTVARRHVVRHQTGAAWRPCDDRAVTSRFLYDSFGTKIV